MYPGQVLQGELCVPNNNEEHILHTLHICQFQPAWLHIKLNCSKLLLALQLHIILPLLWKHKIIVFNNIILPVWYLWNLLQLIPCPVGFALQNGVCNCDPYLSNSNVTLINQLSQVLLTLGSNYTKYLIVQWIYHTHHILIYYILSV